MTRFKSLSERAALHESGGNVMKATEFNNTWSIGDIFSLQRGEVTQARILVKTTDIARDFECGCIVEIDKAPYFVKVGSLTPES